MSSFELKAIGRVSSPLTDLASAPCQADEGAPEAWLVFEPKMLEGLRSLRTGDEVILITWLDRARRDVLSVHPRGDISRAEEGVFSTRSPHRPKSHWPTPGGDYRHRRSTSAGAQSRSVGWDTNHRRQADTRRTNQPTLTN